MRKILVVEDEEDLGNIIVRHLRGAGYEPTYRENGAKALEYLKTEGADLVITDVNMPEMDGLELCNRIRSDPRLSHVPVLMLTVRNGLLDQVDGYETGVDDYITKPFELPLLLARIKALERRTLGAAS